MTLRSLVFAGFACAACAASCKASPKSTDDASASASTKVDAPEAPPEGASPILVRELKSPTRIGRDRDAVYVVESNTMTAFKRVEKKTGATIEYSISVPWTATGDDHFVYVAHELPSGGELVKIPKDDPSAKPVVLAKVDRSTELQLEGADLYWLERDRGLMSMPASGGKPKMLEHASDASWLSITPDTFFLAGAQTDTDRIPHPFLAAISRSGGDTKHLGFKGRYVRAVAVRDHTFYTVTSESTQGVLQNELRAHSLDPAVEGGEKHHASIMMDVRSLAVHGNNIFIAHCPRDLEDAQKPAPPSELLRMAADGTITKVTTLFADSCASDLTVDGEAITVISTHGVSRVTTTPF